MTRGGPFTVEEGRRHGYSDGELRSPSWARPFAGVRSFDEPQTVEELALAYAVTMKPEEFWRALAPFGRRHPVMAAGSGKSAPLRVGQGRGWMRPGPLLRTLLASRLTS
jgi:hypothetical protein